MMKKKFFWGIILIFAIIFTGCGEDTVSETNHGETTEIIEDDITESENALENVKVTEMQFPVLLEEGIEIGSLFPFEGFNPDAGNEVSSEIASISVKNISGKYLEEAYICLLTNEEKEIQFLVTDLPAGASAMAFSTENNSLEDGMVCIDISCTALFCDEEIGIPEEVMIEENETQISVTNISDHDMSKVTVCCRCPLDEEYFGGMAYRYEIQGLAAGETKMIDAEDFLLGMVKVVRVDIE